MATAPKNVNETGKMSSAEQGYILPKEAVAINVKPPQSKVQWFNPESFQRAIQVRVQGTQGSTRKRKSRKTRKSRKSRKTRRN